MNRDLTKHPTTAKIDEHNAQEGNSVRLGHNAFSDMTLEEFHQHFKLGAHSTVAPVLNKVERAVSEAFELMTPLTLPDYMNWIQLGAVTPVKVSYYVELLKQDVCPEISHTRRIKVRVAPVGPSQRRVPWRAPSSFRQVNWWL